MPPAAKKYTAKSCSTSQSPPQFTLVTGERQPFVFGHSMSVKGNHG
jgi:hypothetical protein